MQTYAVLVDEKTGAMRGADRLVPPALHRSGWSDPATREQAALAVSFTCCRLTLTLIVVSQPRL